MKVTYKTLGLMVLAVLSLSGCMMLGPDYREPVAPVQPDWIEVEEALIETTPPVTARPPPQRIVLGSTMPLTTTSPSASMRAPASTSPMTITVPVWRMLPVSRLTLPLIV